ncbi:MAG: hypothetical protein AAGC92_05490 [Pseudomonadota bacterium]
MRLSEKARRRLFVYSRRAGRCLTGGLRHPCLFMHLPKCGGTSLANALYAAVPLHQRIAVLDAVAIRRAAAIGAFGRDDPWLCHEDLAQGHHAVALREQLALTHMAEGARLLHGHLPLSASVLQHVAPHYRIVTLMREPVARSLSNFQMAVRAGLIAPDIDAWLEGPFGRRHATVFLRYLSGSNAVVPADEHAALRRAEAALKRIALIGFLDALPDFVAGFRRQFGVRIAMPHFNAAPVATSVSAPAFAPSPAAGAAGQPIADKTQHDARQARQKGRYKAGHKNAPKDGQNGALSAVQLSPTQRQKLEALCLPDLFLYAAARRAACAEAAACSSGPDAEGIGPLDAALG